MSEKMFHDHTFISKYCKFSYSQNATINQNDSEQIRSVSRQNWQCWLFFTTFALHLDVDVLESVH